MKALALAIRFLTVLPWPGAPREPEAEDTARALARFPFVGLLIGGILILLDWVLASAFSISVRSALLIIALVVLTRGLHLGGLSDFADALGSGSPAKEASPGSMGALLIIGALLLKFVSLSELQGNDRYLALVLSPILARAAMAYLIASPPPVKDVEGDRRVFARPPSPREGYFALGWSFLLCLLLGRLWGILLAVVALCAAWGLKRLLEKSDKSARDAPGATGEIVETMTLVLFSSG